MLHQETNGAGIIFTADTWGTVGRRSFTEGGGNRNGVGKHISTVLLGRRVQQGPAVHRADEAIDVAAKLTEQADDGSNQDCRNSIALWRW